MNSKKKMNLRSRLFIITPSTQPVSCFAKKGNIPPLVNVV